MHILSDNVIDIEDGSVNLDIYSREKMAVCTLSGRIIFATGELKVEFGTELAGKNLNDFIDDKLVSKIISNSALGKSFYFDCLIAGKVYTGLSEKDGNAINILFANKLEEEKFSINNSSLRYLEAEINSVLSTMLGTLQSIDNHNDPAAMFARRNVYRLVRVARNVFDTLACESGEERYIKQNCDVLDICREVVDKIKFPLRSVNVEIEAWHDGGRHISFCVAEHIERIISNIISCSLKGIFNNGKTIYIKIEVIEKKDDILISVIAPHKVVSNNMISVILSKNDNKASLENREMCQTLSTIKALAAYNGGNFLISTDRDGDRMAVLLPKVPDSDKLKLKAPEAKYSAGASLALIELSEILPDSVY